MKNRNHNIINIPTLFTSLNLFCGFLAATLAAAGNFVNAAWLIFIAGIFDALDGRIARAAGLSSEFGLQMDSLSDVVSAGLAPSLLAYQFSLKSYGHIGLIMSFLPLLFGAFRLARFNVYTAKEGKKHDFIGMPAPMAGVTLGSVVILYHHTEWQFLLRLFLIMVPLVSLLMISTLKYESFPRFNLKERGANRVKLALFFVLVLLFAVIPQVVLFLFMMVYLCSGPFRAIRAIFRDEDANISIIPPDHGPREQD